jgi:putative membrane protein
MAEMLRYAQYIRQYNRIFVLFSSVGVRRTLTSPSLLYCNNSFIKGEKNMNLIANILTGIVALLHFGFLYLEMFLWDKPRGMKSFRMTEEFAKQSKTLAMNQGLYNGFLAAGLIWGIFAGDAVKIFFLSCVIIAGIFGAIHCQQADLLICRQSLQFWRWWFCWYFKKRVRRTRLKKTSPIEQILLFNWINPPVWCGALS